MKKGYLIIGISILFLILVGYLFISSKYKNLIGSFKNEDFDKVIVIDAGHGGGDPGTTFSNKIYEKDIVLDYAFDIGNKLKKFNYKVIYTRENDLEFSQNEREDLKKRVAIIDKVRPDLFLSIHLNGSEHESAKGVESWTQTSKKSILLGEKVQDELSSLEYTTDRGLKTTKDRYLYILNKSHSLGILLELGFLTNYSDREYIMSDNGRDLITNSIVDGILSYFQDIDVIEK